MAEREGPWPGLLQGWPAWRLAPSPGRCPPLKEQGTNPLAESGMTLGERSQLGGLISPGRVAGFLAGHRGFGRHCPPAPSPLGSGWGSHPSFLEFGSE